MSTGNRRDVHRSIDREARDAAALEGLTTALIKLIGTAEIPAEEIADIGRASGARRQVSGRGALIPEVGRLGFGPKELLTESDRSTGTLSIRLRELPFRTAVESEGAVCQLHRGIVVGIADTADGRLTGLNASAERRASI